jgi:transposase
MPIPAGNSFVIPENLTLLLPPYSPGLNPAGNVWEYLRKQARQPPLGIL